jgi:hypothetical protein
MANPRFVTVTPGVRSLPQAPSIGCTCFRAVPSSLRSGPTLLGSRARQRTARCSPQRSTGSTAWPSRLLTHCSTSTPKRCRGFAPREVEPITSETQRAAAIEHLVIGTLLYEPLLATLRRMAHESESAHH